MVELFLFLLDRHEYMGIINFRKIANSTAKYTGNKYNWRDVKVDVGIIQSRILSYDGFDTSSFIRCDVIACCVSDQKY